MGNQVPVPWLLKSKCYSACKLQLWKPVHLEPVLHNEGGHCNEKPVGRSKEQPLPAAPRGSLSAATKTQRSENRWMHKKALLSKWQGIPIPLCWTSIAWYPSLAPLPPSMLCHELHSKCQQLCYKEAGRSKILNKDIQILNLKVLLNSHPLVCNYLW